MAAKKKTTVSKVKTTEIKTVDKTEDLTMEKKDSIQDDPKKTAIKEETKKLESSKPEAALPKGRTELTTARPRKPSLVVDERVLPDSGLPTEKVQGILDIATEGSGLLRPKFAQSDSDIYISASQIRRFNLRVGDLVTGVARRPKENERYWGLLKVERVNGVEVDKLKDRGNFEDLVAIYPDSQIKLTTDKDNLTTRVIDIIAPIGFGQRGLIVSPPKAGKTWLLKDVLSGIAKNYPEDGKAKTKPKVHLMAVLIGERPEEVTDIIRHMKDVTNGFGEVASSNFDEPPRDQTRVGELALERAKRLVENGQDVVIVLDSITRLARAYNLALPTSGRTLTGGFDPTALFPAKKFFGGARKIEDGGSLTIIGTCLISTGSRMDDLIYEEFKGTGNMELHLDRKLADKRIYPSISVSVSGTRQEELLYSKEDLQRIHTLRRMLEMVSDDERTQTLLDRLRKTESNKEFLDGLNTG